MRRFILTAVTDTSLIPYGSYLDKRIETLCRMGVRRIVLREKWMGDEEYDQYAEIVAGICRKHCAIPVISHHIPTALRLNTELQLSMDELRDNTGIIGEVDVCASVHSVEEAIEAERLGASSVTAGHIYPTCCKKGVPERGIDFLKRVVESVSIPVYAIGGINLDVIDEIYSTGASGACLMSVMMNGTEEYVGKIVKRCFDINRPSFSKRYLALYAVTDNRWLKKDERIASKVEEAILGGATIVQLREKGVDRRVMIEDAEQCLRVCRSYGVPLIINDDVSVASEVGADGVHLGQDDVSANEARRTFDGIIGVSAHNVAEAAKAFEDGADYIGCGAVFSTYTKSNTNDLGVESLGKISEISKLPMVAIGGIDETNIRSLKGTGISGVAVVSAIFSKDDVRKAAKDLRAAADELIIR